MALTALHRATTAQEVENALVAGVDIEAKAGTNKDTALMLACHNQNMEVVEALVQCGASLYAVDSQLQSPLTVAATTGNLEIVRLLLENGADPFHEDGQYRTPFNVACRHGHIDVAQTLLDHGADINKYFAAEDSGFTNSLAQAVKDQNRAVFEFLIKQGADVNFTGGEMLQTALHVASRGGSIDFMHRLIEEKANVNIMVEGVSPLMVAAVCDNEIGVKVLLQYGADPNIIGHDGMKAAQWTTNPRIKKRLG